MAIKHLGQSRPTQTDYAEKVYSPPQGVRTIVRNIMICNSTTSAATFRLYLDNNRGLDDVIPIGGGTFDESTALFYDISVLPNDTMQLDTELVMDDPLGQLAFEVGTASALTLTVSGEELGG